MVKKSCLLTEQFEKLVVKNKFGSDIYAIIESFFLQKPYEKVCKSDGLRHRTRPNPEAEPRPGDAVLTLFFF